MRIKHPKFGELWGELTGVAVLHEQLLHQAKNQTEILAKLVEQLADAYGIANEIKTDLDDLAEAGGTIAADQVDANREKE